MKGFLIAAIDHGTAMQGVNGRNVIMLLAYRQRIQYPAERLE